MKKTTKTLFSLIVLVCISCQSIGTNEPELIIIPVKALQSSQTSLDRFILVKSIFNDAIIPIGEKYMSFAPSGHISGRGGAVTSTRWGFGAEHAFLVDVTGWGSGEFEMDIKPEPWFPLTFKVAEQGYVYLCGAGTVTMDDGTEYTFGYNIKNKRWIKGLKSSDPYIREGSCEAISRLGIRMAIPDLVEVLTDTVWEVRRNSCEALGVLGDSSVLAVLENMLTDENDKVRASAETSINQIRGEFENSTMLELFGYDRYMFITIDSMAVN